MRVSEMLTGVRGDLAIKIFGPDLGELNASAEKIAALLQDRARRAGRAHRQERRRAVPAPCDDRPPRWPGASACRSRTSQNALRAQVEGQSVGAGARRQPAHAAGDARRRRACELAGAVRRRASGAARRRAACRWRRVAQLKRVDGPVKIDHENAAAHGRDPGQRAAAATWSASSRRRRPRSRPRSRCRPAIAWPGAASSRTSSAPPSA